MDRLTAAHTLLVAGLSVITVADAFVSPKTQTMQQVTSSLNALPEFNPTLLLSDGLSAATYMNTQAPQTTQEFTNAMSEGGGGGALGALRTFFVVITAAVFGLSALVYLTAAFIVPKAAEQLERDTKRLRPGLWEEYTAKLEDGQTMANRPDLLQELGNIMQPIIAKDYEDQYNQQVGDKANDDTTTTKETPTKDEGGIIDAQIVKDDE